MDPQPEVKREREYTLVLEDGSSNSEVSQVGEMWKAKPGPSDSAQPNGLLKKTNYTLICTGDEGEQVNMVIQAIRASGNWKIKY